MQPPTYCNRRRKLRGNKDERSEIRHPPDLLGLPDEQFVQATQGARWRRLWEG